MRRASPLEHVLTSAFLCAVQRERAVTAITTGAIPAAATTGNLFRYDASTGQYIFNWSTKGMTIGKYRLYIDLGDGVTRTVDLGLK